MARPLPPLPKALRSVGSPTKEELARRIDEWARGAQELSRALREGHPDVLARLDALEAVEATGGGGGGGGAFGSPVSLAVGDSTADGASADYARADHQHGVPLGSPVALPVGGAGADGASGDFADAEHEHALPAFGTGAGEFAEGDHTHAGLGSGYVDTWNADLPPSSPHAQDDECSNGVAIDAKWTLVDPGADFGSTAVAFGSYDLQKIAGSSMVGYYQAIPNAEFSVVAQVGLVDAIAIASGIQGGLWVSSVLTNAGGGLAAFGVQHQPVTSAPLVRFETYSGFALGSPGNTAARGDAQPRWVRMRLNGTTFTGDYSFDGLGWYQAHSLTLSFTPAYWGWGVQSLGGIARMRIRRIRVASGAGASAWDALMPGRMQRVAIA